MRKIKFRYYGEKWHYIDLFEDNTGVKFAEYEIKPKTTWFSQYTGLKDKNGKEIYEGDFVRLSENVIHEGILVECVWSEDRVQFIYKFLTGDNKGKYTDMVDDWRKYEVIGNIYENPELVKK